ncbi:BamA/TamA family outer membrane protein [Pontibacter sp. SGAir0037]|uniref:BamA/TamA family outer membrane protein n=1 Tax=Pontibacter sp. SGAir0037 TaxID=2571030 RepID=UPI0010CD4A3A|nr:BamA/TamA family outer membrane protein [Pontibacter sp. SGAir0037]QCR23916.1 hypothetical protein C1N53_17215 [Pontibacter sp. SGAir0037]
MYKIAALVCLLLLQVPFAWAQEEKVLEQVAVQRNSKVALRFSFSDEDNQVLRQYTYKPVLPDAATAKNEVQALVYQLQQDAYLTASADSMFIRQDTLHVKLHIGNLFELAELRNGNLSEGILVESGFREKFYRNIPFKPAEYVRLQQRILSYAEQNGYPFASVRLDSVVIEGGKIKAALMVEKAFLVTYDSLLIVGGTKTKKKFLMRYLQLYPGQPYNQEQIAATQRMLTALPYVRVQRPPQVRFLRDKAQVIYFLEDRQANQIDGVIGFLPDPGRSDNKLLITGEANLHIRNITGTGKSLGLQWRRVGRGSVTLNGEYIHPNIFGTPFEVGGKFNLLKQDSTFITVQPRLHLSYNTLKYGRISFLGEWRNSRLLAEAPQQSLQNLDLADARTASYGFNYLWNNLDDFYFPKRGLLTELQIAAGRKQLLRNAALEKSFYDTLQVNTTQLSLALRLEKFTKLGRSSSLLTRLRSEALLNNQIFLNDMYRLGGLYSIRGFDDFFFYASSYAIATLEYRLYTDTDSYVLLFYDQGYYRSDLEKLRTTDMPYGLGGGISFSTGAGVFQLVYSVGKSEQQQLGLKNSKIHFGITSKF